MMPFLALDVYRTADLSGDEFAQPISIFKPLFRMAKAKGLRVDAIEHAERILLPWWATPGNLKAFIREITGDLITKARSGR